MITGELKNKIDSIWNDFAAGGLVNPLEVVEQVTYLIFICYLDDSDNVIIAVWTAFKASNQVKSN